MNESEWPDMGAMLVDLWPKLGEGEGYRIKGWRKALKPFHIDAIKAAVEIVWREKPMFTPSINTVLAHLTHRTEAHDGGPDRRTPQQQTCDYYRKQTGHGWRHNMSDEYILNNLDRSSRKRQQDVLHRDPKAFPWFDSERTQGLVHCITNEPWTPEEYRRWHMKAYNKEPNWTIEHCEQLANKRSDGREVVDEAAEAVGAVPDVEDVI